MASELSITERLKQLDQERAVILEQGKSAALKKAQQAIAELSEMGFHYRLVERSGKALGKEGGRAGTR